MASQNLGRVVGSKIYAGNATNNNAIATDLASRSITPLIYDIYISSNKDIFQYQLVENNPTWVLLMNIKGEAGTFKISKTYSSVAAMEAGYATDTLPIGALVIIETGDTNNTDNAKLYVKGDTQYNFLTDMSGTQGIQGPKGDQGIQGNTGETGATFTPSVDANGNISWTNDKGLNNPTSVNIKGPQGIQGEKGDKGDKGDKGEKGDKGDQGIQGEQGIQGNQGIQGEKGETGATFTPSVDTNGNISWTNDKGLSNPATINIKGVKGDQGLTGANGKTPTLTINDKGELISTIED